MRCLVSEPKDGVNAMDEVTKKQPGDDGRQGDTVIMDWCWKNQDEEKCGEERKNREFNAHGAGESLNEVTLKRRREMSNMNICPFLVLKYTRHPEGLLGNKTPQLCKFTERECQCNCCLREDGRLQQAACQMENNVHVELVPKFDTRTQEDKEPYAR
jgi:hypothetical protein